MTFNFTAWVDARIENALPKLAASIVGALGPMIAASEKSVIEQVSAKVDASAAAITSDITDIGTSVTNDINSITNNLTANLTNAIKSLLPPFLGKGPR